MKQRIAYCASWALTETAVQAHRLATWALNAVLRVQHWAADDTDEAGA